MVRKTRSTLKPVEKSRTDSPKRGRNKASSQRRRSASRSDDSEDDTSKNVNKNVSPSRAGKGSSDNESDKESKMPLKKRGRSMAMKEETQQPSSNSKSRWDKQHKTEQQDNNEEVKEDQDSKGKSKNKNSSNNENVVIPDIENENVQVTDESPSDAKDDNHESQSTNGVEKESDVGVSKTSEAETTSDQRSSEVPSGQNVDAEKSQDDDSEAVSKTVSRSPSKENTDKSSEKYKSSRRSSERSRDSDKDYRDRRDRKSRDRRSSERSIKESSEQKSEHKHSERSEDFKSKKIKLKRPPGDKHTSESSDEKESKKEESTTRKRITLKRPESKLTSIEESKSQVGNLESSPKEQSQAEEWSSSYETGDRADKEKIEEKPARKKITLKRSTIDDIKSSSVSDKKEIGRSISLQEHKAEIRRRSSAFERSTSENEEKTQEPIKSTKVVKLNRNIVQDSQEPPPPGAESFKKYKWGESSPSIADVEMLDLDTIRQVCPNLEFLKEDEVHLEIKEIKPPKQERRKTFTELEEEEMENIEAELNAEPEEMIEIKENVIAMNRKISIVDDTASKMRPPPSPPRNPVSDVLFITNLVRPFTVKQLKELLERTGKIKEDGFWTDRIKSKCYVHYEKAEEAEATRNALHGVNWPIGNGKKLIIDYATVEDLENAKNPPVPIKKEKSPEKENKKPVIEDEREDRKVSRSVKREWNLDRQEDHRRRRSRSKSRERQRKHTRRSYTPEDYHGKKRKHEEPAPQKAMDDLFLKTKATPSIYWQPLSPEEIALKQQQRQARLEENKRRLEEISRISSRGIHRDRDRNRDRNFRRR